MELIAQAAPAADPLGVWGGLILQGGAFALLTYVVVRLAPMALKEAREEREKRDATFQAVITGLEVKFDERSEKIVRAVEAQTQSLASAVADSSRRIEAAVTTACKHKP